MLLIFLPFMILYVLQGSRIFFARDVALLPIQLFVIALALLLLIPLNSICCLNVLFLLHAMNHLILMWTLNMNAGKK